MSRPRRDVLRQRLQQVFQEVFDDETIIIEEGTTAEDVDEWDSLTHIILIVATEKEFGLRLNAAEVGKLANVGALLDILVARSMR
jgi:acyl carrier protein